MNGDSVAFGKVTMARVTSEHVDARKTAILEAAGRVFGCKGPATATMQEIADEAGISTGAIYLYFPSKDELLREFYAQCLKEGPLSLLQESMPEGLSAIERLKRGADRMRRFWREQPAELRIGTVEAALAGFRNPETIGTYLTQGDEAIRSAVAAVIEDGQSTGEIDPALDAQALAAMLHASAVGIHIVSINQPEQLDTMFGALIDMIDRLGPCRR